MLIGITGHKFSGKSTVANLLLLALNYEVDSFARPLKEIVCALSGCTMAQLEDYDFKENKVVPEHLWAFCANENYNYRSLLQGMGDYLRSKNPNIFIDSVLVGDTSNLIISDVRFPNESEAIKELGGIIIRVEREGLESNDTHRSETAMCEIVPDYIIQNKKGLKELRNAVGLLVELWKVMGKV